jgi:hypothetical protein
MNYNATESRINQLIDAAYANGLSPLADDLEAALATLRYAKENGYIQ